MGVWDTFKKMASQAPTTTDGLRANEQKAVEAAGKKAASKVKNKVKDVLNNTPGGQAAKTGADIVKKPEKYIRYNARTSYNL